jgi:hypothetical protein
MPVDCRFLTTVLHNGKLQHAPLSKQASC